MAILQNIQVATNTSYGDYTVAYDAGTASDRILFVWVVPEINTSENITGVTFNGVSMTADTQGTWYTDKHTRLFYLVSPASGINNIIVDMPDGNNRIEIVAAYVSGYSAVSNLARDASPTSSTTPTVTVTSANGESVVAFLSSDYYPTQSLTASSPAIVELDQNASYTRLFAMSETSTGSSVTIDGTLSQGGARWIMAAASLTPVSTQSQSPRSMNLFRLRRK